MTVRYNGHTPEVKLIDQQGEVVREFEVNASPNHTGLAVVYWNGTEKPALLYNGGALWNGKGEMVCQFRELSPHPVGNKRQGWYHCIPVDIAGDEGEEGILYNPWERYIYFCG